MVSDQLLSYVEKNVWINNDQSNSWIIFMHIRKRYLIWSQLGTQLFICLSLLDSRAIIWQNTCYFSCVQSPLLTEANSMQDSYMSWS